MKTILIIMLATLSSAVYPQKLEPTEKFALMNITVTNSDGKPKANEIVILQGKKTGVKIESKTDASGKAQVLLPKGDTYLIKYKNFSKETEYSEMEIPDKPGLMTAELSIEYEPAKTYTLDNVFFDTGKATLRKESYTELNELAEVMKNKETLEIEIAGHTDNVGSDEANLVLSQGRADAVRNYLLSKGIDSKRVTAKGYGETQPVADNDTDEGRQKNRRTEVRIIKE